jgi:hypothetical protein
VAKVPPPKPQTEEEKAVALLHKKQFDAACPLFEKLARAAPDNATLWGEWGQCELHRSGHRKIAIEASSRAATLGDRPVREAAYDTLRALGQKVDLPAKGCEWLPESPGGACNEQMWGCGYDWESPSSTGRISGHAVTFGDSDDERDVLDTALREGTALRPQLAAEWKALVDARADELACSNCHQHAVESVDGLVNQRAMVCFRQKTGRMHTPDICGHADADCDVFTGCLDEAASLAKRADTEHNRALWPEAADVEAAAHKVCDATCGVIATIHCEVVSVDACRGFIGYACVDTQRGRRPQIRLGELSINDGTANWTEPPKPSN